MYVSFGNMRMEEIEEALGIKFTEEHTSFLKETHVDKVSEMQSNKVKFFMKVRETEAGNILL